MHIMAHQNPHRTGQYHTYINYIIRVFVTPFSPLPKIPNLSSPSHDSLYYQPKQCTIDWKSLTTTINLQCLLPPKWVAFNDPCIFKNLNLRSPEICFNSSSPRSHAQIQRSIHPPNAPEVFFVKLFHGIHLRSVRNGGKVWASPETLHASNSQFMNS